MKVLRVIIVEDEAVIARNLAYQLQVIDSDIIIRAKLASVTESVAWFNEYTNDYDLVFMDIRLADGLSFDIFKRTSINKPVIFLTAYNDYAVQAFKNNGIDYILKPFDELEISKSLQKFKSLTIAQQQPGNLEIGQLLAQINLLNKSFKKSFLVHYRDKLIPVEAIKIAWFYTANEIVYANTADDRRYVIEFTMEQLEQQLDPAIFFRANRQFLLNRVAITEVNFYFNGRLSIKALPETPEQVLVSKARAPEFRQWMDC